MSLFLSTNWMKAYNRISANQDFVSHLLYLFACKSDMSYLCEIQKKKNDQSVSEKKSDGGDTSRVSDWLVYGNIKRSNGVVIFSWVDGWWISFFIRDKLK